MPLTSQLAKHLRDIHFGGNWTSSNLKDAVSSLSWQQATSKVYDFNSIATLTYHTTYYVSILIKVLQEGILDAKDAYSFNLPPIESQHDWEALLNNVWKDAELAATLIEALHEEKLNEIFVDEKYGNYFRNIMGVIEHMHYHLGQIVLIKKIILKQTN